MSKRKKTHSTDSAKNENPEVIREITDYDYTDTTDFIDLTKPMTLADVGIHITPRPASRTEVISLRLPTPLLNEIRAIGLIEDVPYTALIKQFLSESLHQNRYRYMTVERVQPPTQPPQPPPRPRR